MELNGQLGKVLTSETELERMVKGFREDESCDLNRKGRGTRDLALVELIHEKRPMATKVDVKVDDVDAGRTSKLCEESLDGDELGEMEDGGTSEKALKELGLRNTPRRVEKRGGKWEGEKRRLRALQK